MDRIAAITDPYIALFARVLMAVLFLMAGLANVGDVRGFAETLAADGVPVVLGGLVFWFLILSGLLLILGAATRLVALAQAGFCIVSGTLAYGDMSQPTDMVMLLKNIALTGGFLFVFLHGPGRFSIDAMRA
ncbi:DoxX family protein [Rhodalgimonas zhirmunskyi]|uniref:DoxX family protein n=1 Tax=Rhodalgimonas zhirmunskyi TaxID=2964767 RepID=A0AAJ1UB66_9RHOB|nr:DoxX family protein [Rhodoalgimonas zhirmunskyi]MDQ2093032.1 DoxX family protein [Rhodoalgimonas zhirmunskyi]